MTTQADQAGPMLSACWCCDSSYPEHQLLRLGEHPEVAVCARCAQSLHRRAVERHDEQHPTTAARLRGAIRTVRRRVVNKGWHQQPVIGKVLRRIDRHLP
jgi:hypothetical protein